MLWLGGSGYDTQRVINDMNSVLKNRGPDQSGIFNEGDIYLAHNRLAIIDPENGVEKALLRNAMKDYLPERVFSRKKSPYPKTQNPAYERAVMNGVRERLRDNNSVLHSILNVKEFDSFISGENETWFGQLMARPQLLAWLIQLDYWADAYNVNFSF